MKKNLTLIILLFISFSIYSQDTYVRPSVSLINLDYNDKASVLNVNDVEVPKNIDYLKMSKNNFKAKTNGPKIQLPSDLNKASSTKAKVSLKDLKNLTGGEGDAIIEKRNNTVLESLIKNRITNAGIRAIVPIKNGEYDIRAIGERGVNSATDQDVNLTSQAMGNENSSNEVARYNDIAKKMMNKSYIVALNMSRLSSYNDDDEKGFEGSISYYIFKLDNIYSEAGWTVSAAKFPNSDINATIVAYGSAALTATNYKDRSLSLGKPKSDTELKKELRDNLLSEVWNDAQRKVDDFQPKTTLLAKRRVSLGTKEGLKIDNRYFVYENVQNNKGEIVKKKRSTMRVKKVANNDGKATGNSATSKLYKIGYGKAKEGMLVQQKEDLGVGISLGYGDLSWVRLDYRMKGITPGLLLFVDVHPFPGKVEFDMDAFNTKGSAAYLKDMWSQFGGLVGVNVQAGKFTALAYNVYAGLEKQIRLGSALYISPMIGAGMSSVSLAGDVLTISVAGDSYTYTWDTEESTLFNSILATGGARVGLQLSSSLSVNFTLGYMMPITGGWEDPAFVNEDGEKYYNLGTEDIFGLGFNNYGEAETDQSILEEYYSDVIKDMPAIPSGMQSAIMLRYEF